MAIAGIALVTIAGIAAILFYMAHQDDGKIIIQGFDECASKIDDKRKKDVTGRLFDVINESLEEKARQRSYKGIIRANSCKAGDGINRTQVYTRVTMIVDIDSVHRSRVVTFDYVKTDIEQEDSYDAGPVEITCVTEGEQKYQDDNCVADEDPETVKYETDAIHNAQVVIDEIEGCYMQKIISATAASGFNIVVHYEPPVETSATDYAANSKKCLEQIKQSIIDDGGKLENYNIYMKK